ncbi:alpha/beta hydrolase family protein [Kitasatospora sp. SUK 42]|uniref:alpha/beta hydrolase n=1 Tax=Kitasatospora sp. SUK 42 TaxID=1588882 RepID=UPI0018CA6BF4|nr:alpha/beta fold hydrolase [Kitasatospora sp. SUK 42]MBV2155178.1 esterase family protein [Kitasatospora sp. SUK 42]
MTSRLAAWRSRAHAVLACVVVAAATLLAAPPAAHADASGPPTLSDNFGLTQVDDPSLRNPGVPGATATDFTITVTTPAVANDPGTVGHHVRIILPADYNSSPTKRYPVLYLLHGSPGDPCDYFAGAYFPQFDAVKSSLGMITVIPDGGARGWYSNWRDQSTAAGAQRWEDFEINQVVPFIDANLRTIADKQHRAIAGISMGGFGALHLAQLHPDLFSQVATMSGESDLSRNEMVLREVVIASLIDAQGALPVVTSGILPGVSKWSACHPVSDPYQPAVDSDALFGSPYPISITPPFNDSLWNAADPTQHASAFAGMSVSIYVGNGDMNGNTKDIREWWLESSSQHLAAALTNAGQTPHFVDYGTGAGWGRCDGGHDVLCWDQDLADLIPRLQQAFAAAGGA